MIPILYRPEEVNFTSEGLGRLGETISAVVTEERNGIFELEFQYPVTGAKYKDIIEGRIVSVTHDETGIREPFVIYRRSAPIGGIVTFNAHHISYELANTIVKPFTADNISEAIADLKTYSITENRFNFVTNKTSGAVEFNVERPTPVRELLYGHAGSLLDVYGTGEWKFTGFTCYLYQQRGTDSGVTIRYGKNLVDITQEIDTSDVYDAIIPYWQDTESGVVVYGGICTGNTALYGSAPLENEDNIILTDDQGNFLEAYYRNRIVAVRDFTESFDEQPTKAQLNTKAVQWLNHNTPWIPNENITVDFVALWQTEEYADYQQLQTVRLCDTVSIYYPELGVNVKEKVIRTDWNVLLDRYDSIELGKAKSSLAQVLLEEATAAVEELGDVVTPTDLQRAITTATDLLTGQSGGYLTFHYDADGHPTEMLIMDTDSELTALNIWRYNAAGWGHSSDGGTTYTLAATLDGGIVADFITAGTMSAARIKGGWLTLGGADNVNGRLRIYDADGNATVTGNKDGLTAKSLTANDYLYVNGNNQSFFKVPISSANSQTGYLSLSDTGLVINIDNSKCVISNASVDYVSDNTQPQLPGGSTIGELDLHFQKNSSNTWDSAISPCMFYINVEKSSNSYTAEIDGGIIDLRSPSHDGTIDCVHGQFYFTGTKSRKVTTKDYGERLLYCYETPTPIFGDIGEGQINEDGSCFVWLDPVFCETIANAQYQVFLQAYGNGSAWVAERHPGYFVVNGSPGLAFAWEVKCRQIDYELRRLDPKTPIYEGVNVIDYGDLAADYIKELEEGYISG